MYVKVRAITDDKLCYDMALATINKKSDKEPTPEWMNKLYRSEHSPARAKWFLVEFIDVPYWVINHIVRHTNGVQPYIGTQRTDRTGVARNTLPQDNPIYAAYLINAQAMINISRKRLCNMASQETRKLWQMVKDEMYDVDPELSDYMVRECVYRNGLCPEFNSCGFNKSSSMYLEVVPYVELFEGGR